MRIAIVIPARYNSSRFKGKAIYRIKNREMILRVADRVKQVTDNIYIATEDKIIKDVAEENNYKVIMTCKCNTGTDRMYQVSKKVKADIYVLVQCDEPLINPEDIEIVIKTKIENFDYVIGSISKLREGDMDNKNVVKVKIDKDNNMLTMTREPINTEYRQCGIYAYTFFELENFYKTNKKEVESIELTRIDKVKMAIVNGSQAVDVIDDVKKIESAINET